MASSRAPLGSGATLSSVGAGRSQVKWSPPHWAARERYARQQRTYALAVEWFVAFLEPDAEDLAEAVELVVGAQHVNSARVHHRTHLGREERWLVLRVSSSDLQTAVQVATDAAMRVIWPPERRRHDRDRWFVSAGHTIAGLAEYEDDELG